MEAVASFRTRVDTFLAQAMTDARAHADPTDLTGLSEQFERELLAAAGGIGILGPRDPLLRAAFDFAAAAHDAPLVDTAVTLAGFAVDHFGSDEQRAALLPLMRKGLVTVCAAYTEHDAGSDLGALTTTAATTPHGLELTGVKTLVTGAHKADWCCTVARTPDDGPRALTMFLVDMSLPGITVTRRPTMNGWTLDEIRFDAVQLPADAVLGGRGRARKQLAAILTAERSGMFHLGFLRRVLDLLRDHLRSAAPGDDETVLGLDAYGGLEADFDAALALARSALTVDDAAQRTWLGAAVKTVVTELLQHAAQEATELTGHQGQVWAPLFAPQPEPAAAGGRFAWEYLERVHGTIGSGPNELQRDTVARLGLGLGLGRRLGTPGPHPAAPLTPTAAADLTDPHTLTHLAEQLGAAAHPSPLVSGHVLAGHLLAHVPGAEAHLADLTSGTRTYAPCVTGRTGRYTPAAVTVDAHPHPDGWTLDGTASFVPHAAAANVLLVLARTPSGNRLFPVDHDAPGLGLRPLPTLADDGLCELTFTAVRAQPLPGDALQVQSALRLALDYALVVQCADMLGAADAALRHAVAHVTTREQFGAPLAALQVVRHRCADMLIDVTLCRAAVHEATRRLADDRPVDASALKALCAPRLRRVTATAHQLCGGQGIFADQPLHLWYRRVKAAEPAYGGPREHRLRVARDRIRTHP